MTAMTVSASVSFPCRATIGRGGYIATPGHPARAAACECERPMLDGDHCVFCGRLPQHTIDTTWRRRAAKISTPSR